MSNPINIFPGAATRSSSPRMGRFLSEFPKVSVQASGSTSPPTRSTGKKPYKETAKTQPITANPSWITSVFKPPTLTSLPILQELALARPQPVGRKNSPTSIGMGENNLQPVDAAGSKRVQARIQRSASAIPQASDSGISPQSKGHLREDTEIDREGGNTGSKQRRGGPRLFQVPKDGQMRPVINLRPLNQFLFHNHFKMEGMHVVRDLQKNDLKDVFLDSYPPTAQEVSTVQMGKIISVPLISAA